MGDPAGIGPEISRASWRALRETGPAFVLVGQAGQGEVVGSVAEAAGVFARALPVLPVGLAVPPQLGAPDARNGAAVIASIERAVALVQAGEAAAVVTNPISKATLYEAGFAYPGHTEFLSALTGGAPPVMMLANAQLRVVPVTVHVSLRRALETLTTTAIVDAARITERALRVQFGIAAPRIAIAGLNPHAGEGGAMGDEEGRLIAPAIAILRGEGIAVTGPYPPDTMFTPAARLGYDVAMCMYHDQGLIPLKTLDMASGVNVTLGLPIIRTSPDHGTAFDIAGQGRADPTSLIAALRLAAELARA